MTGLVEVEGVNGKWGMEWVDWDCEGGGCVKVCDFHRRGVG